MPFFILIIPLFANAYPQFSLPQVAQSQHTYERRADKLMLHFVLDCKGSSEAIASLNKDSVNYENARHQMRKSLKVSQYFIKLKRISFFKIDYLHISGKVHQKEIIIIRNKNKNILKKELQY